VGYVIMLEKNKEPGNLFEEFLPFVGSAVCEVLLHTEEYKGLFGSQKENLLYELIHGVEEELVHIRVEMNQLKFPSRMGCLVVKPNEYLNNMQATTFLKEQIEYILPGAFFIKEKENLVFICKLQQDGKLKSDEEKRLLLLFQQGVVHMGISRPCTDIMELKDAYKQSCQLYKISMRLRIEKEIMYFSTYNFYAILNNMNEKDLMQYSHPALKILRDYDQAHNGELYRTLHVYIECQSHMQKTAASLTIHRNSLSYRISKILDLTGIDLTDCDEIFRLSYGFKVEHYCRIAV
jgi:PucR family transcriptional regulator, proline-responsive transcriptional activator